MQLEVMDLFRESFKLLRKAGKSLILFEAGVQLVTFIVLVPLVGIITDSAIHLAGLKFLTNTTVTKLLTSIWTYPLAALIVLIAASQILLHFTGVIACMNAAHEGRKLTFGELIYELVSGFKRMFSAGAGTLVLHLIMLIPAISLPVAGGFISVLGIPDILTRLVSDSDTLILAYSAAVLLSMLLNLKWMIALPIYVCRHCSFHMARQQSKCLISGKSLSVLLKMLLWSLGFFAAFIGIIILLTGLSIGGLSHFGIPVSYGSLPLRIIRYLLLFVTFIFSAGAVPYLAAGMFVRYEKLLSCRKSIGCKTTVKTYRKNKKSRITAVLAAIALLWVDGIYIFRLASGDAAVRFVLDTHPLTIAHRGASFSAPENTSYAFIAAIEQGADGIELDVQQTKDGIPVVIHDLNLKRVAGINQKVSSFTFEELSQIDVGSWYGEEYGDARIMSLEDVFILTDGKIFMNIELKRGSKNDHLEQQVVSLIEKYDMENKCCVTSFSYDSLKKIKKYNSNIKTGLIMSIATGNFYTLDAADAFSIKSTFISTQVVSNAHLQGKEIYAWTVNNTGEMRRMLNVNADHIITDRPELLLEQIDRNITEDTLLDTALNLIS
jgi:glycerophosphoryl diester phosphodiesterase